MTSSPTDHAPGITPAPLTFWKRDGLASKVALVLSAPDADDYLTMISNAERVLGRVIVGEISLGAFRARYGQQATAAEAAAAVELHDASLKGQGVAAPRPLRNPSARAIKVLGEVCGHVLDRGRLYPSLTDTSKLQSILGLTGPQLMPTLNLLIKHDLIAIGETIGNDVTVFPTARGAALYLSM